MPTFPIPQADEVCLAWALLDLSSLPTLQSKRSLSLPLRAGPLVQHVAQPQEHGASGASGASGGKVAAPPKLGSLQLRLAPVPPGDASAALLPAAAVASLPLARAVGCYRQLLVAATLGGAEVCGAGLAAAVCCLLLSAAQRAANARSVHTPCTRCCAAQFL